MARIGKKRRRQRQRRRRRRKNRPNIASTKICWRTETSSVFRCENDDDNDDNPRGGGRTVAQWLPHRLSGRKVVGSIPHNTVSHSPRVGHPAAIASPEVDGFANVSQTPPIEGLFSRCTLGNNNSMNLLYYLLLDTFLPFCFILSSNFCFSPFSPTCSTLLSPSFSFLIPRSRLLYISLLLLPLSLCRHITHW